MRSYRIIRYNRAILAAVCVLFSGALFAQVLQAERAIGGVNADVATAIVQSADGGYVMGGSTSSFGAGHQNYYVLKLDKNGNLLWTRGFGGTQYNLCAFMVKTSDGGFAVSGSTDNNGGNYDFYLVKIDSAGNVKWNKTYGGGTSDNTADGITETKDHGFALSGTSNSWGAGNGDLYVVKTDSVGNIQWTRTIGGPNIENGYAIIQNTDGSLVMSGLTWSYGAGNADVYVVKLDSSGNLVWAKTIGGTANEEGTGLVRTSDGGYVVVGQTSSFGAGMEDMYVIKLDRNGNLKWTRTIGGANDDWAYGIIETADKGLAVTGWTASYGAGNQDVFFVKLDSAGTFQWARTMGGPSLDGGYCAVQTPDKGFAISGETSYGAGGGDVYFIKLDSMGNSCASRIASPVINSGGTEGSGGIITSKDSGVSGGNGISSSGGVFTNICTVTSVTGEESKEGAEKIEIYPNPSSGIASVNCGIKVKGTIQIIVTDELGHVVYKRTEYRNAGDVREMLNLENLSSGIYALSIQTDNGTSTGKLVIMKN